MSFTTPTPFELWRFQFFGATTVPEVADVPRDGLGILLKNALALDPTVSNAPASARFTIMSKAAAIHLRSGAIPRNSGGADAG